jgi:cell wall-associated NlpC family hydrolase
VEQKDDEIVVSRALEGLAARFANQSALRRAAIVLSLALVTLVAAGPSLGDPRINAKEAEAQRVIAQIDRLGHQLDRATEAYNGATYHLEQIRATLRRNELELAIARHDERVAEHRLAARLRDLYVYGTSDPTLDVLLGAHTLSEAIEALGVQNQVSKQDSETLRAVVAFRRAVARTHARLARERAAEERVVAERAAEKARIAGGLAEQRRLLESVRSEIIQLQHQEALQQAQLAALAAARLAQQRVQEQQALNSVVVGATAAAPGANGIPSATVVPPSLVGSRVVAIAEQYLGRPYVWGAAGPYAFDCSGLVTYVFAQVGILLPHFAAAQWNYGTYVPEDQLQPGDLVFFANLDHVGIYVGNGEYIQAPQPGDVVKITPLSEPWSAANYYGAKRITS